MLIVRPRLGVVPGNGHADARWKGQERIREVLFHCGSELKGREEG